MTDFHHWKFGDPSAVYRYTDTFVVARYETADGKEIAPWSKPNGHWEMKSAEKPRPLYGNLNILAPRKFLLVEGEKCVDHLARLNPSRTPITWPGGAQAWKHADWSQLEFADVLLFPDHDVPGFDCMDAIAAHLQQFGVKVSIIGHRDMDLPKGWDIADTDWDLKQLNEWATPLIKPWSEHGPQEDSGRNSGTARAANPPGSAHANGEKAAATPQTAEHGADLGSGSTEEMAEGANGVAGKVKRGKPRTTSEGAPRKGKNLNDVPFVPWESLGLSRKGNDGAGPPHAHLANAQRILAMHPDLVCGIWYDEFHDRIFQDLFQDGPAEWSDHHDTRLTVWMIEKMRISEMAVSTVQRAVDDFARMVVRNEPKQWLQGLSWDGIERLPSFMADAFGSAQNEYTAAVGRCFMVGMVARIFRPGCQVDYMPVFEGKQGIRKSSALHAIGGKWFSEIHEDVTKKDFFQCLQGRMLVEFSELHAFRRQEVERIKGIITCRTDRYRDSYARRAIDHPRQCVFSGTTNRDDWVQDDTGARRFWPITCGEINLDYIIANREQIFAEAVARYARAESWWDIDPELAMNEQNARRDGDAWSDYILPWAATKPHVTVGEVLTICLQIPPDKQDKSSQMRVASVLRVAKWSRKDVWNGHKNVKKWVNPSNGGEVAKSTLGF